MPKPMLTEDYIIRMINQAIAVLVTIAKLKAVGQYQEALQLFEQTLEQLIGLRVSLVKELNNRAILNLITMNGSLDTDRLLVIANLFKEEGDILAAQNKIQQSIWSYQRAIHLFLEYELNGGPKIQPTPNISIETLVSLLENVELPIETEFLLSSYFEQIESYHEGYKVLIKLSENHELCEEIYKLRIDYLERSLDRLKEEISEVWMSRAEIDNEIAILQGKIER